MLSAKSLPFHTNANKDFLRSEVDFAQIEVWYHKVGRRLKYLGLPAWEMLDIIAWDKFLDRFTTIERQEDQQHLMFLQANVKDVEHRLHALYGEFDQILLQGRDQNQSVPDWPYDLVNLDYFGGFLYSDLSRPKALRKLISNQANFQQGFLLIITQHIRDGDRIGEKSQFLEDLRRSLKGSTPDTRLCQAIDGLFDWYGSPDTPDSFRQSLYMNAFFRDIGESEHFDVECRPAILYSGTGNAQMLHFLTNFTYRPGIGHKTVSTQSLLELIDLGLREVRNGAFAPARRSPPRLTEFPR
ncbi:MAG: hypothetical protein WBR26_21590 [Candidatus Acidiferrum sp.]